MFFFNMLLTLFITYLVNSSVYLYNCQLFFRLFFLLALSQMKEAISIKKYSFICFYYFLFLFIFLLGNIYKNFKGVRFFIQNIKKIDFNRTQKKIIVVFLFTILNYFF
jgi:hypothetical protein